MNRPLRPRWSGDQSTPTAEVTPRTALVAASRNPVIAVPIPGTRTTSPFT